jgi:fatty acid/phospholipid biosynthesis enzyme
VKSHGGADVMGFCRALDKAHAEVVHGVLDKIAREMAAMPAPAAPAPAVAAESNAG